MNFLLRVMRAIHFFFGISAPDPRQEKMVVFIWMGILITIVALGVGFTLFIVPYVIK
jgi:hypothetical protein